MNLKAEVEMNLVQRMAELFQVQEALAGLVEQDQVRKEMSKAVKNEDQTLNTLLSHSLPPVMPSK